MHLIRNLIRVKEKSIGRKVQDRDTKFGLTLQIMKHELVSGNFVATFISVGKTAGDGDNSLTSHILAELRYIWAAVLMVKTIPKFSQGCILRIFFFFFFFFLGGGGLREIITFAEKSTPLVQDSYKMCNQSIRFL